MAGPSHLHPSSEDAAAVLVDLLNLASWIPQAYARWTPLIESLLEAFLRRFDAALLNRLLDQQHALPPGVSTAERAARMAGELTALHKLCQMLARNPMLPSEARATLAALESLPPDAIPDAAVSAAVELAAHARPGLQLDSEHPKVARGSVADVFRFRDRTSQGQPIAFKTVRADSLVRVQNEASILMRIAEESSAIGMVAGPHFASTLSEALRDAAGAILREIDFAGEAANLQAARAFYHFNHRIRIPATNGNPVERGIFMEFVEGVPLLDAPFDAESRRDAARLIFRRLILDPLFSGLPESVFHADPHAGNLLAQTQKHAPFALVVLDWSQAGRLAAPLRHALIVLCLCCVTGNEPSAEVAQQLLQSDRKSIRILLPRNAGDPLRAAFEIVQELALQGHPVPLNLLLLRKSFFTLDGITRQLDPDFNAWLETVTYVSEVFASESAVRTWSIPFPWLDRPDFYRSGLTTQALAIHFARALVKNLCKCKKNVELMRNSCEVHSEAQESPGASQRNKEGTK